MAYASERITARGRPGQPDLYQDPGTIVDFTYRKMVPVMGYDLTFSFEARNLLAEDYEEYQELGSGRVNNNAYDLGRSFSVGVSTRF